MQVMPQKPASTGDITALTRRLAKAKTSLILEHPFVGAVAINMPFILTDDIPAAATNGKRVLFNPSYISDLTDEELKFLVAHEVFHPMMSHNFRRGGRDQRKWNRAADYVINELLTLEGIGKMPSGGLRDSHIYNAGSGTSDGIYNILEDDPGGGGGNSGDGDAFDECEDAEGGPAEQAQAEAEMKIQVAQAAQAAKMMGKMSANMQRLVDEVLQPKVDWRAVLQRFIEKARTDQRTYARPNRIFAAQGLYLPSKTGEVMGELLFAVDCSGSIDQPTLNQFAAEIRTVKDDCLPTRIHVVYFDSEVSHHETYTPDDALDIKPHGGGGTAFSPVFRYAGEHGIDPVACVFLTDLYCSDFGAAPDYPVLWVSNGRDNAPFGEVVMM
jgi:predicted metal-dependent peptidase